jgi:hypothetical protein
MRFWQNFIWAHFRLRRKLRRVGGSAACAADGHLQWPRPSRSKSATPLGAICDPLRSCDGRKAVTVDPKRGALRSKTTEANPQRGFAAAPSEGSPYTADTRLNPYGDCPRPADKACFTVFTVYFAPQTAKTCPQYANPPA